MAAGFPEPQYADTNGIRMAYYEMGTGTPVLLCHGFPELAYSWRRVMPAIADAGFRVIAMDQRGYGRTDCPPNVEDYGLAQLTADLAGLLDALGLETAIFAGHDWGGPVVWTSALLQRSRVAGVIGVNTPFRPRGDVDPLEALRAEWGDGHYMVNFNNKGPDHPDCSDRKFEANLEMFLRGLYRRNVFKMKDFAKLTKEQQTLNMERLALVPDPPGRFLLDDGELAYFMEAFTRTGLTPGINWYRNFTASWRATEGVDPNIHVPCLMIEVSDDPSGPPGCTEPMRPFVKDLERAVIGDCGHWTQHEKPAELSAVMVEWLKRRFG